MKKVLCSITDSEAYEYSTALNNKQTFLILKRIFTEQAKLNYMDDIDNKINEYSLMIDRWWERITDKYTIPYFIDKIMTVDLNRNEIFIET